MRQLRKGNPKRLQKVKPGVSFVGCCLGLLLYKNRIRVHCFGVYFYAYFWHRLWEASGTNSEGSLVISGSILASFCNFVGVAAKLPKCNTSGAKTLFFGVLGDPFYIISANFPKFFPVLQSR